MEGHAKRQGFTLVELLIVIVVIGILSAMMMLSSTESVSTARATKIISDLRNLKTAALAWYVDNVDYVDSSGSDFTLNDHREEILKYLGDDSVKDKYEFSDTNNPNISDFKYDRNTAKMTWFVWYDVRQESRKVLEKLASRGTGVNLRYTHTARDCNPSPHLFDESILSPSYGGGTPRYIGLHIRGKWGSGSSKVF